MTVFSLLKPWGPWVQRLVFVLGRLNPPLDVDRLAMIHFARLAVIDRFPDHGQPRDDLRQVLQLFESNYNGSFNQYIDTFVDAIPGKMKNFWGTSYGFPWRLPLGPFKRYIESNEFPIDHYYVRNPDASVKMVGSALRVMNMNAQLLRDAPRLDPAAFTDRFRTIITAIQRDL
jgi:hypothetical protein